MARSRLTWRKQPDERGLARVVQSERGLEGRVDGVRLYTVNPVVGRNRNPVGWYWVFFGEPAFNTLWRESGRKSFDTKDEAKADAIAHYKGATP